MAALQAGQILEGTPYQVVRELGAGGMGVVYEVQHVRLKKRYVAKVIHDQVRGDESVQKRMEREADVLGKINHPNIVQVHDVGLTPDGTSYFVMEKLDGMDLREAIERTKLGVGRAIRIAIDILEALDHVHRRGIVHRDVKPENVFLARQPNGVATKVLDFGIVHILDGDGKASRDRITKTGGFVGTLYYAAPEQMAGQAPAPASDVYAAGLVLYELVAGRGPFDDDAGVGLARCFKPAPRLGGVSVELADAVAAALEHAPEKRPAAGDLARALRQILAKSSSGTEEARDELSDLFAETPLAPPASAAPPLGVTELPKTPLMHGAPPQLSTDEVLPTAASAAAAMSVAPDSPRVAPGAPTSVSPVSPLISSVSLGERPAAKSTLPLMAGRSDTSPGLYNTVDRTSAVEPPRASPIGVVVAIGGFLVLLSLLVGGAITLLRPAAARRGAEPAVSAPTAMDATATPESASARGPASARAPATAAPTPATEALSPHPSTTTASAPSPSASVLATRPAASARTVAPAAPPSAAAPGPTTKAGQAKKEGYQDNP